MATPSSEVKGYLVLGIEEASGKTQSEQMTWDTTPAGGLPFEPFVKVELRGGARSIKAQTRKGTLVDDTVTWQEQLILEVLEGSNELRLMVCREKYNNGRKGTAVVAACGIYVNDILEAVPLQKYFQLFRPAPGGEGGYILISINYVTDLAQLNQVPQAGAKATENGAAGAASGKEGAVQKAGGSVFGVVLGVLAAVGGAAALAAFALKKKEDGKKRK